jgi:uncharacterized membrane protein
MVMAWVAIVPQTVGDLGALHDVEIGYGKVIAQAQQRLTRKPG